MNRFPKFAAGLLLTIIVFQTLALPFIVSAQTTPTPTPTSTFCGLTQQLLDVTGITDLYNSLTSTLSSLIGGVTSSITGIILGEEVPVKDQVVRDNTTSLVQKEYVCDPVFRFVSALLIRSLTDSIIGWIQGSSGDGEEVGFVANFEQEFRRQLDARGGELLNQLAGVNLCGNIGAFLQISLRTNSSLRQRLQCTVTDIVQNVEDFFQDFNNGGWPAFIRLSMQPQNNPYGAFLIGLDAKLVAEGAAARALERKLLTNNGYSGVRKSSNGVCDVGNDGILRCTLEDITKTPGHLVANMLERTIGSGYDYAYTADEISEAIGDIITTLIFTLINSPNEGIFNKNLAHSPVETPQPNIFTIITTSLPSGVINQPYTAQLTAINGVQPYAWSISSGSLPPGSPTFTLSSGGFITGTPNTLGTYSFTVKATDSVGTADTQTLIIQINAAGAVSSACPGGSQPIPGAPLYQLPNGKTGTSYCAFLGYVFPPGTSGGTNISYISSDLKISGTVPPGLQVSSGASTNPQVSVWEAKLIGTPSVVGPYSFTTTQTVTTCNLVPVTGLVCGEPVTNTNTYQITIN